jgi:hypothetical protein
LADRKHVGIILSPSLKGFDSGAATFCNAFIDEENRRTLYLYYTGASNVDWSHASIGVAQSVDGVHFEKCRNVNPIVDFGKEAVTPVVFKAKSHYYMAFAFRPRLGMKGRRIGIAYSTDPLGPWRVIGKVIAPQAHWEGNDIDLGSAAVKIKENPEEFIIFYSNATNKRFLGLIERQKYTLRHIGILKVRIRSPSDIEARRYDGNPLENLNGPEGAWNESLFCPGYINLKGRHFLLPTASTYSIGYPYKQYIGIVSDESLHFGNPKKIGMLINGPEEKNVIIPRIKSEIGLDTPNPILKDETLYLYYAAMDRTDRIWKTALTMFRKDILSMR